VFTRFCHFLFLQAPNETSIDTESIGCPAGDQLVRPEEPRVSRPLGGPHTAVVHPVGSHVSFECEKEGKRFRCLRRLGYCNFVILFYVDIVKWFCLVLFQSIFAHSTSWCCYAFDNEWRHMSCELARRGGSWKTALVHLFTNRHDWCY
jgi:hypothetical protein